MRPFRMTGFGEGLVPEAGAHQAGLRDRCRHRMEAVEAAGIGNEFGAFGFERVPDRPATLTLRHAPIADCARYDNLRRTI